VTRNVFAFTPTSHVATKSPRVELAEQRVNECLTVTVQNVQWAAPQSRRGLAFGRRFEEPSSDVICLTEGCAGLLPNTGFVIDSAADYGYRLTAGRRKVLLWSRAPWRDVDSLGTTSLPSGRFVAGVTDTPLGPVRFIGVCIPWRDAHVRTGRRDRQPWEDHLTFLRQLPSVLAECDRSLPAVLLGDFNQRVPRARQPRAVFSALSAVLDCGLRIVTGGEIAGAPSPSIDHIAVPRDFVAVNIACLSNCDESCVKMSDHFGLRVSLSSVRRI
jgi:endonuclease/exonuclease/phosphatase family metal-dependent hydrolase